MLASIIVIDFIKPNHWFAFLTTSSPLEAIAGIPLFLIAKNTTIFYNEIINKIAASTFAVYLIHCPAMFFQFYGIKLLGLINGN